MLLQKSNNRKKINYSRVCMSFKVTKCNQSAGEHICEISYIEFSFLILSQHGQWVSVWFSMPTRNVFALAKTLHFQTQIVHLVIENYAIHFQTQCVYSQIVRLVNVDNLHNAAPPGVGPDIGLPGFKMLNFSNPFLQNLPHCREI